MCRGSSQKQHPLLLGPGSQHCGVRPREPGPGLASDFNSRAVYVQVAWLGRAELSVEDRASLPFSKQTAGKTLQKKIQALSGCSSSLPRPDLLWGPPPDFPPEQLNLFQYCMAFLFFSPFLHNLSYSKLLVFLDLLGERLCH